MQKNISFLVFIVIVILAVAVGGQFVGGEWYQAMNQPDWNPPAILLAVVWAVLYVMMAVAGWMVWDSIRGMAQTSLFLWALQLALGVVWSWLFFGLHRVGWAMAVMAVWFVVVVITTKSFRSIRVEASSLMLPLAAWLLFALVLNFTQWQLNGGGLSTLLSSGS